MQVLKFGGSSMAGAKKITQVVSIISAELQKGPLVVVVSAMGKTTDALLHAGELAASSDEQYKEILFKSEKEHLETVRLLIPVSQQSSVLSKVKTLCNDIEDVCNGAFLLGELSFRTRDRLLSYGELLSSCILSYYLKSLDIDHIWKDARELIRTNSQYNLASVNFEITNRQVRDFCDAQPSSLILLPGFIASDDDGNTTTLGRGGSDYTASIVAAASGAEVLQIWTDVSGIMTADPRLVNNARIINRVSYQEAMELSHFGAKVIYPPTIEPVMKKNIPVLIKNTFSPEQEGSRIENENAQIKNGICGISGIQKIALLSLEGSGMLGVPGFSKRLFEALAKENINVILITQSSSEHSICVGVDEAVADKAKRVVDLSFQGEINAAVVNALNVEKHQAIVALVGDNMKSHPGISGKMFSALGRNGINVRAIAQGASERNISAVIASADLKKAMNVLHEEFFETTYKQLNLFVVGVGNVGSRLLDQLEQQKKYLLEHLRLQVRVTGIANSRKMTFNDSGIDLAHWKTVLEQGEDMNMAEMVSKIHHKNFRNSVFADVTASAEVASWYEPLLEKSISIVACNKIACSATYGSYKKLKDLAREYNCQFLFETNVGAGLPVIGTLNDLVRSGDKVEKIEAVLSGTLNFVFNEYDASRPFAAVVKQAQDEGYTEPDPRLDLSGTDVARKILILAREAGEFLEMDHIVNHTFMPESCMKGGIDEFYEAMKAEEPHFSELYQSASSQGAKLKVVASYERGKASVGLRAIPPDHEFYHLEGKDNIVLFHTTRYGKQPLMVKGAGAGAEVTASGVFADIIKAGRH